MKLNENEVKLLNDMQRIADHYGECGYFPTEEVNFKGCGLTINQYKGYLSDLQKKGIIYVYANKDDYYHDACICDYVENMVWK